MVELRTLQTTSSEGLHSHSLKLGGPKLLQVQGNTQGHHRELEKRKAGV